MDEKVIKKTQDTLGKIIKKPPLTEKLLSKPPFRFLHDIMTSVIKTTGFMKGLFSDSEMQSDNVKEKDAKMAFLQKVIDIVQVATGQTLSAKTSKIVAGHEPEKTNELLQALAAAVNKKPNNDNLVQMVLKGETGSSSKKDKEASADKREKSAVKKEKEDDKRGKDKDRDKSKDREKDKENRDESRNRRQSEKRGSVDGGKDKKEKENKPRRSEPTKENGVSQEPEKAEGSDDDEDGSAARIPRPSSAKGSRQRQREDRRKRGEDNDEKDEGSQERPVQAPRPQQRSARPSSARPAPPKPKKQQDTAPEPEIRIGSGKRVTQVIVDNAHNSDDDDDNFMVEEGAPPEPIPEPLQPEINGAQEAEDGEHGGLVKKILETKKELEGGSQQAQSKKVEIEKPAVSDAARRKEREMVMKEIEKLRESIQTLTRSANPLGKIMDYVQEDMDSMQKELEKWKQENKEHAQALKREQGVTESSIEPLKGQLAELDQAISDQLTLIAATKANILRNDSKISKMLGSVTKS